MSQLSVGEREWWCLTATSSFVRGLHDLGTRVVQPETVACARSPA